MFKIIAFGGVNFIRVIYCYFYGSFHYGVSVSKYHPRFASKMAPYSISIEITPKHQMIGLCVIHHFAAKESLNVI